MHPYGFMKIRMPHISPVDKEILMGTFLAGCLRFGYVSGNLHHGSIHLDIQQLLIEFLTKNSHNALTQRRNRKIEKLGVIAVKGESYFGMNQSDTFKFRQGYYSIRWSLLSGIYDGQGC